MATFGVTLITGGGGIVESVDLTHKAEFKRLINSIGEQSQTKTYDSTFEFSAKGRGTSPYSTGVGNLGLDLATGKAFVTKVTESTKNDDFNAWEASGISYPTAS
jgi:hypothetical protein